MSLSISASCRRHCRSRPRATPDDIVVRIVADRATGLSLQAIATALNADHIATAGGGTTWRPNSVQAVVRSVEREHERAEQLAGR